jgi:hypothetical protein
VPDGLSIVVELDDIDVVRRILRGYLTIAGALDCTGY